jgi:2-dehydropantoate 2-reductase
MSSSAFREPLHILGAGSIGLLWAASIRSALPSYPVTLLLRDHHRARMKDGQMNISWKRLHQKSLSSEISLPIQFLDSTERIQNLVVATKAYQAKDAVKSVLDRLDPSSSKIIVLCNGALSVRDELSKILENIPLVLATTTHGAYREEHEKEQLLVHAGVGKTFVEEEASSADLAELWNSAGLNCQAISSADMNRLLWKKLAANCVINPLTALFQCTNGELLMEPAFPQLQQELLGEIAQIAKKTADQNISEDSLSSFVFQVIQDTRNNKSSMFQDILKKQRTEVDHLNGYVVQKGRDLGIESPANEEICQRILELQNRW